MSMDEFILCMDIGGTNIRAGMVDKNFDICEFRMVDSPSILTGDESITNLKAFIRDYIKGCASPIHPMAISLGFPATIDKDKRFVVSAPNVKGINNIPIVDLLQEEYDIPVFIDRDVNMNICYDIRKLNLKSNGVIIACYIGTGFGNAIWINGSIYSGFSGSAGELGHIPVLGKADLCGCGNKGCIENYSGGRQLAILQSRYFPNTGIADIFKFHKNEFVIDEFIKALAIPIASEINILDPDYVIIGGGVVHMRNFPFNELERYIKIFTRKPYPAETLKIIYSIQQQENGVIGAGINAFERLRMKEDYYEVSS